MPLFKFTQTDNYTELTVCHMVCSVLRIEYWSYEKGMVQTAKVRYILQNMLKAYTRPFFETGLSSHIVNWCDIKVFLREEMEIHNITIKFTPETLSLLYSKQKHLECLELQIYQSQLCFHGWKSPEIAWGEIWIEFCVRFGKVGSVEPH
jgi:hypothetical protein